MREYKKLIVAIGSNYDQKENVDFGKKKLKSILGDTVYFSREVWTHPVGIKSDNFLNCICVAETHHTPGQLRSAFKRIEKQCGRCIKNNREGKITLDLDILQYGDEKFHTDDWKRDYVTKLIDDYENGNSRFVIDPTL